MSWRAIRKNQAPLTLAGENSSSGSSSDDDDSSSDDSFERPPPKFVTKSSQARKVVKNKVAETSSPKIDRNDEETDKKQQQPQKQTSSSNKKQTSTNTPSSPKAKPSSKKSSSQTQKSKNKSTSSSSSNKKVNEDDALLDKLEALQEQQENQQQEEKETVSTVSSSASSSSNKQQQQQQNTSNFSSFKFSPQVLKLLEITLKLNSGHYDPRNERIRRFGKESVEKIEANKGGHRFRPSPFVTPNSQHWPKFDPCGLRLRKKSSSSNSSSTAGTAAEYVIDVSSEESSKAEASLQATVDSTDVDSLFGHWKKFPYHLPTLMQVYRTSCMINQEEISRQSVEMALYTVGIVLTAFPELGCFNTRCLHGKGSSGSQAAFHVLSLGMHKSLKTGCGSTAWNLNKLILSIDGGKDDVEYSWSLIDYTSIRASQFDFFKKLCCELEACDSPLLSILPQLCFGKALAICFDYENNIVPDNYFEDMDDSSNDSNKFSKEKLEQIKQGKQQCRVAVADAVLRMPACGAKLALAVGVVESPLMQKLSSYPYLSCDAEEKIINLYIKRNTELWRTKSLPNLLRQVIEQDLAPIFSPSENETSTSAALSYDGIDQELLTKKASPEYQKLFKHYSTQTPEHIMGEFAPAAIPEDILNFGNNNDQQQGGGRNNNNQQLQLNLPPEVPEHARDTLLRFQALFGPPRNIQPGQEYTIQDVFDEYDKMLKERIQERNRIRAAAAQESEEERKRQEEASERNPEKSKNEEAFLRGEEFVMEQMKKEMGEQQQQQEQEQQQDQDQDENNNNDNDNSSASASASASATASTATNDNSNSNTGMASSFFHNVMEFFRTMLPISIRDELILEELKANGIEDPVQHARNISNERRLEDLFEDEDENQEEGKGDDQMDDVD